MDVFVGFPEQLRDDMSAVVGLSSTRENRVERIRDLPRGVPPQKNSIEEIKSTRMISVKVPVADIDNLYISKLIHTYYYQDRSIKIFTKS
jgi:hypothetical protein